MIWQINGWGNGLVPASAIHYLNTLWPRQDGRHFPDDILKCIFLNEDVWISLTISLKCVRKVRINNIPSLVQIMAWRRPGDKPLSEPVMVSLLTHICVTQPQWVIQCWLSIQYTIRNTFYWHFDRNSNIFIQGKVFASVVCRVAAMLFRPLYLNPSGDNDAYMCQ